MDNSTALIEQYGICAQLGAYRLLPVFQNTTEEVRRLITDMWERNRALPAGANAEARARQVVVMALGPEGKPVGVSTVYKDSFAHTGMKAAPEGLYYFFRTFVQPSDRVHHLSRLLTACTYDHLRDLSDSARPKGVVIVAENPKLTKPVLERLVGTLGWDYIGEDSRGKLVFRRDF
ncbi:MAG TPA: hypothetical protein VEF76_07245 [Patescibacteria group bacterium]|nr:hypothetical protein [Patescibacteria group bacterium]